MAVRDIIQAAGGSVATGPAVYVEDVFSTYLYNGTGASQTITNGIDLATKGGMVWWKSRTNTGNTFHNLVDTIRQTSSILFPNSDSEQFIVSGRFQSFNTDGVTVGSLLSTVSDLAATWTFRKQAKFFDVQSKSHTTGSASTVDLSTLGTVGMVIVKRTDSTSGWYVWHRSLTSGYNVALNTSAAQTTTNAYLSVSGTTLTLSSSTPTGTYIVYAFAHEAGGFGAAGADSVVACGGFTGNTTINLGWEPQFLLVKSSSAATDWNIYDNMRAWPVGSYAQKILYANRNYSENDGDRIDITSTGFTTVSVGPPSYIYLAIRRGPMKTPTDATKVYGTSLGSSLGSSAVPEFTSDFPVDTAIFGRPSTGSYWGVADRLRGKTELKTTTYDPEGTSNYSTFDFQNGWFSVGLGNTYRSWHFRRAPGFFDNVCYAGTGANRTVGHNLSVAPELVIVKARNALYNWFVYAAPLGNTKYLALNTTSAAITSGLWNNTTPTLNNFSLNGDSEVNGSGNTYIAYLFATCPGVSKVGSYNGSGTTKQIDCGFAAGARFVMIKRTDSTGSWYVWDSARGIVSGADPYILLNAAAPEVTNTDYIDPYSAGFEISSTAPPEINANGGSFIYLAIA